jgi:hypothetical protein
MAKAAAKIFEFLKFARQNPDTKYHIPAANLPLASV